MDITSSDKGGRPTITYMLNKKQAIDSYDFTENEDYICFSEKSEKAKRWGSTRCRG